MNRRVGMLLGIGVLALALAGCATPVGTAPSGATEPTTDAGVSDALDDTELDAAWLDAGRMVGLVTYGSSTCVPTAVINQVVDGVLEVELLDDPEAACTRDLVPRASAVALAGEVDPTQELEIRVTGDGYAGDVDLDGLPTDLVGGGETEYQPSAGWTDEDGQFVLLTWGSSGCPPELESVEATGAAEITATFATPPADQVCTMDMAPRVLVAAVPDADIDEDDGAELVLTGGEFSGERVRILPS